MEQTYSIDDSRITSFGRLFEAYVTLTHWLNDELEAAFGLNLSWYGVLLLVGRSPGGVRPIGELMAATAFTSGGVTRLVDRMERAGLVERRPCPTDRRVQYIALTDAGRDLLQRSTEVHVRGIQEHMIDALEPGDVEQLDRILDRIVHGDHGPSAALRTG